MRGEHGLLDHPSRRGRYEPFRPERQRCRLRVEAERDVEAFPREDLRRLVEPRSLLELHEALPGRIGLEGADALRLGANEHRTIDGDEYGAPGMEVSGQDRQRN